MFSRLFPKRISIIMTMIRDNVLSDSKGLVPFLIETGYLSEKNPLLFNDLKTREDLDRFESFWQDHSDLTLAQSLISSRVIGGKIPEGSWQFKDECEWAVESGLIPIRDITFWTTKGRDFTIAELSNDKVMDILNTGRNTDDDIRELLLNELIHRGNQALTDRK